MNNDPFDQMMQDAFRSRPAPKMPRPSIGEVRRRARRRQQRRSIAMVGTMAAMGTGGVAVLAMRHGGDTKLRARAAAGPDTGPIATACYNPPYSGPPTTITSPTPTTIAFVQYTIVAGDSPTIVAQRFGISIDALNAANAGVYDYPAFFVGAVINIPRPGEAAPGQPPYTTALDTTPLATAPGVLPPLYYCVVPGEVSPSTSSVLISSTAPPPFLGIASTTTVFPGPTTPQNAFPIPTTLDPTTLDPTTLDPTTTAIG